MQVLIAPDKFAGTLNAVEVAHAIAEGWRREKPDDAVRLAPMSDGGPGFVDVLEAALGGELMPIVVTGPLGEPTPATLLLVGEGAERTAYVESAQACGLHLVAPEDRRPGQASTYGVGELLRGALDAGARRIVVGLGGSGTNDAGAGMLAALGAHAGPAPTPDPGSGSGSGAASSPGFERLRGGGAALRGLETLDLEPARDRLRDIEILAASDVDNPLLGLRGATNVFGPQKGVTADEVQSLDAALEDFARLADPRLATAKGAGAAGGLGYALMLLGARRVPGIETIAAAVGLESLAQQADLVITGEGSFDVQSAGGKVVAGVAVVAERVLRPCVVVAGQVHIGAREMRTLGVQSAYGLVDLVGKDAAFGRPAESLATVAGRVARTWSR